MPNLMFSVFSWCPLLVRLGSLSYLYSSIGTSTGKENNPESMGETRLFMGLYIKGGSIIRGTPPSNYYQFIKEEEEEKYEEDMVKWEDVSTPIEFVVWGIMDMGDAEALKKAWVLGRGRGGEKPLILLEASMATGNMAKHTT